MSSLYNMVHGENVSADMILDALQITRDQTGRYRDCWIEDDQIAVYTRNGGGNRAEYQPVIDALKQHPCYVRDADDGFDSTYCTIYFRIPPEHRDALSSLKQPGRSMRGTSQ